MTILDYVSIVAMATGIVCTIIQLWLHDFDLDDLLYGERR